MSSRKWFWGTENGPTSMVDERTGLLGKANGVAPQESRWQIARKLLSFLGPGFVVSVGYVDPGNWATGLEAGAKYQYELLSIILLANLMAMLLQHLAVRLGILGEIDLAAATRKHLKSPWVWVPMWILAEVAIIACDLAEVIGGAIALKLLFGVPVVLGILVTMVDVLFFLSGIGSRGFRPLELVIVVLIAIVGCCFGIEVWLAKPEYPSIFRGMFLPDLSIFQEQHALFVSLGIIGATVMPHNLYLHSGIVQHRLGMEPPREAVKLATWDSSIALFLAFLVNASILITAAAGLSSVNSITSLEDAAGLLGKALGPVAGVLFALALLASGQSSTISGTLAGQLVFEGFVRLPISPWKRRLITRTLAVSPALLVVMLSGEQKVNDMLLWSQAVLSVQLPFAIIPLVIFTADPNFVGEDNLPPKILTMIGWTIALVLIALNLWMLIMQFGFGVEVM
uniref:Divalent metal cation transporter MntH n=1 Tax=Rhodosorus marinus TaxID=101924 RepID=A0A7S0G2A5_9RHOD|mmetsp:Transcript_18439/g.26792  ORF Transcript_18439/g.26792 Transcript_18439/m.26792 type:complete len:454 (+) Transcript_18439:97-1458(+)|eukprot:CAMPEP_0184742772 /NCGR_PEP_ID=MMETSP0315-20130426/5730_1 /TAXON_ID=101924 /ORGANISM="Rhodosorus marinus, Strain UTEX LB 2760" /LENGTH=453 /DNA_ID=CAMNT_0027213783 /DNA_START=78 /DNA_END=1439 /DNA_ORIENTATION=+